MDPIMDQFNPFHIAIIRFLTIKFCTYCILSIKILNISMCTSDTLLQGHFNMFRTLSGMTVHILHVFKCSHGSEC
jgi:hypothetical protein